MNKKAHVYLLQQLTRLMHKEKIQLQTEMHRAVYQHESNAPSLWPQEKPSFQICNVQVPALFFFDFDTHVNENSPKTQQT